jgi:hypothetical protein
MPDTPFADTPFADTPDEILPRVKADDTTSSIVTVKQPAARNWAGRRAWRRRIPARWQSRKSGVHDETGGKIDHDGGCTAVTELGGVLACSHAGRSSAWRRKQ